MIGFDRYGTVKAIGNKIIEFNEKSYTEKGLINAGAYILKRNIFEGLSLGERFSFEKDYLEKEVEKGMFYGFRTSGYFIDIGIPEDYNKAQIDFKEIWK